MSRLFAPMLPHAIKELTALGLLPALDRAGIRTRELIYMNRQGQTVWQELRGMDEPIDSSRRAIIPFGTCLSAGVHELIRKSCRSLSTTFGACDAGTIDLKLWRGRCQT